jgi:hypothetical protein
LFSFPGIVSRFDGTAVHVQLVGEAWMSSPFGVYRGSSTAFS